MLSSHFENAARRVLQIRTYVRKTSVPHVYNFTPYVIIVSACATLGIVQLQRLAQPQSSRSHAVTILACIGLCLAAAMFSVSRWLWRNSHPLTAIEDRHRFFAKILLLSAQIGILLLPISAYFAVWQSHYSQLEWAIYGFLDKRFVLSLYWTAIFTFLILPPVLWKVLDTNGNVLNPAAADTDSRSASQALTRRKRSSRVRNYAKIVLALSVAYFMYGPPWNIQQLPLSTNNHDERFHPGPAQAINNHEQVHLGPLQAIDKGYLPDIGPASQQYGPGFQLAMYSIMKISGQFSVVGFRQAQATIDFIGYCLFALIAFQILDIPYAILAVVFSLTASPFRQIAWIGNDSLLIWGWPNPLRYMGSLILAVLLPSLLTSQRTQCLRLIAVGVMWGLFIWMSPENLITGVACSALLCTFMWATDTISLRRIFHDFALVSLGALLFWLPIAGFYAVYGRLGEYFSNVFLVGRQVLSGFSNTPAASDLLQSPYLSNITYFAVPLLILCGLVVLFNNMALSRPLDRKRLLLLALLSATLANMFGSLTRSDASHLANTLISFPILIALLIQDLPGILSPRPLQSVFARLLVVITVLMFVSNYSYSDYSLFATQFKARTARFFGSSHQTVGKRIPDGIAFRRTGYERISQSALFRANAPISVANLLDSLDELRTIVGGSRVYVASFPYVYPGLVYFLADLTPPPVSADPATMVFSNEDRAKFLEHFKGIADQVDYIVTTDPKIPEVDAFLAAHPGGMSIKRTIGGQDYFIFGVFQATDTH